MNTDVELSSLASTIARDLQAIQTIRFQLRKNIRRCEATRQCNVLFMAALDTQHPIPAGTLIQKWEENETTKEKLALLLLHRPHLSHAVTHVYRFLQQ